MHITKWCHWYNFQVFDAPVTHSWQVRSHKPAYHQHIEDDWLNDCRKSTWRLLCMKWRALGPAQSLAGRCRWLISVLTSHHWHRRSESGQTSKMKTNPLQALGRRSRTVSSVERSTVSNAELKSSRTSSYKIVVHAEHRCLGWVASAVRRLFGRE